MPDQIKTTILHDRDIKILEALALRVRLLSLGQIARAFFDGNAKGARRRMTQLAKANFVKPVRILARATPRQQQPIFVWELSQPQPRFQAIVVQLRSRWLAAPTRMTTVYLQGQATAKLFGAKAIGKLRHVFQASHDLGFAETFLLFLATRPDDAKRWLKEDLPRKILGQIPDGLIVDSNRVPVRAIEYCGLYPAIRLKRFHIHCAKMRLPYELW